MEPSTQLFLSSLSQTSVTVIVLLISGIIAFSIYQLQREITFKDEIFKERINIKSYILNIRNQWHSVDTLVPVEFRDYYKKQFTDTPQATIWSDALLSINFEENEQFQRNSKIISAFNAFSSSFPKKEGWGYPLRLSIISEFVTILSRIEAWKTTKPSKIFPVSANELGYTEWKRDFEKIYAQKIEIEKLIRGGENSELSIGVKEFLMKNYDVAFAKSFTVYALRYVKDILHMLDKTNESVKNIEEKQFILSHSFSQKINLKWILFFTSSGFFCGVIIPLLSINNNVNISPTIGNLLFIITVISIIGSMVLFFQNATNMKRDRTDKYTYHLRYEPLLKVLTEQSKAIPEFGMLELSFLYDFKNAYIEENIPEERIIEIKKYLALAEKYNAIIGLFSEQVKINLKNEFSFVKTPPFNTGYSGFSNSNWLNSDKRNEQFKDAFNNKKTIGFNIHGSRWTRDLAYLPISECSDSIDNFISKFDKVASNISSFLKGEKYYEICKELELCNANLRQSVSTKWIK